ncbi:hypothetical protein TNCV_223691 [Trichonephila clavipes]|nr:hypothetical protein TNCV_223691 [Trichonephila clavipes]
MCYRASAVLWERIEIIEGRQQGRLRVRPGPRGCDGSVVNVSDHGRHVMSSIPVSLKTRRVGQRCTLNMSRAEKSSHGTSYFEAVELAFYKKTQLKTELQVARAGSACAVPVLNRSAFEHSAVP